MDDPIERVARMKAYMKKLNLDITVYWGQTTSVCPNCGEGVMTIYGTKTGRVFVCTTKNQAGMVDIGCGRSVKLLAVIPQ